MPHLPRIAAAIAPLTLLLALGGPALAVPPPRIDGFCVDPIPPEQELCCAELPVADAETVTVDTPLGALVIELYSNVTPETVANFLGYIDRGDYTDTLVHRTVPAPPPTDPPQDPPPEDFVIQTGGYRLAGGTTFEAIERLDPVINEPCLSNVLGTVAMARVGGQVSSGTSEWFVNLSDNNTFLDTPDEGFTVFGRLIEGLPVASDIVNLLDTLPETPIPPLNLLIANSLWVGTQNDPGLFFTLPALSAVPLEPGPHGCFDVAESAALLTIDPQSSADLEPNDADDLPFYLVSTACEGFGAGSPPPPIECDASGRRALLIDPDSGSFLPDPSAEFLFAEATLSCDAISASDEGLAMRRSAVSAQLAGAVVQTDYTINTVPEPALSLAVSASLLTLAGLQHRQRRRRR